MNRKLESKFGLYAKVILVIKRSVPKLVKTRVKKVLRFWRRAGRIFENKSLAIGPYRSSETVATNISIITKLLDDSEVEFIALPREDVYRPRLVIDASDAKRVRKALQTLDPVDGWNISIRRCRALSKSNPQRLEPGYREGGEIRELRAGRYLQAPNGRRLDTRAEAVEILAWTRVAPNTVRVDGEFYTEGTLHRHPRHRWTPFAYVSPAEWARLYEQRHITATTGRMDGQSSLTSVIEPIDVVYTWVNGADPQWLQRKANALGTIDQSAFNETANVASRFQNRDELKYSLRSLEMYAPWVRKIFIVTDDQVPAWLDLDHPQITIVDHKEIFRDPSVLPVYNSHAIESQLHHIRNLSSRYIYLNDDVFLGRPCNASLFFTGGGLSKFFLSRAVLDPAAPSSADMPVLSAAKHNREIIGRNFGRLITQKFKHTPHPQQKSVLLELEASMPEEFMKVSASRLRHPDDISVTSALHHYWAYAKGKAVEGKIRYDYFDLAKPESEERIRALKDRGDLHVFCINDTNVNPDMMVRNDLILREFFEDRFPFPSSFEI